MKAKETFLHNGLLLILLLDSIIEPESTKYPSVVKDHYFFYEDYDRCPTWTRYFVTCVLLLDVLDEDTYSRHPDAKLFKTTRLKRIKIKKRRVQLRGHTQRQSADAKSSHNAGTNPPQEITPTDTVAPSQEVNQTEPEPKVPVNQEIVISPVNNHNKKSKCHHLQPLNRTEYLRRATHCFHEGLKLKESHYEVAKKHFKTCEYTYSKLNMKGDVSVCNWVLGELSVQNHYYSKAILFYKKAIKSYGETEKLPDYQPPLSHIHDKVKHAITQRFRYICITVSGEGTAQDFSDHTTSKRQELYHTGDLHDCEPQNQEEYHSHITWQHPVLCEDAFLGELVCPQSHLLCQYRFSQESTSGTGGILTVTEEQPNIYDGTSLTELVCPQSQLPWYRYLQEVINGAGDDGLATVAEETHVLSISVLEEYDVYELPSDLKLFISGNEKPTTSLVARQRT